MPTDDEWQEIGREMAENRDEHLVGAANRGVKCREELGAAEQNLAIATSAIRAYLKGDYDHPRRYRPDHCPHGTEYWQECAQCDIAHFTNALARIGQPEPTVETRGLLRGVYEEG